MKYVTKTLKEYTALITAVLLFFISPYALRLLDPTAGTYDAGILQIINFTIIQFCVYMAVAWTVTKHIWPALGEYLKFFFNHDFKALEGWQKVIISLSVYFLLFLILVILSRAI